MGIRENRGQRRRIRVEVGTTGGAGQHGGTAGEQEHLLHSPQLRRIRRSTHGDDTFKLVQRANIEWPDAMVSSTLEPATEGTGTEGAAQTAGITVLASPGAGSDNAGQSGSDSSATEFKASASLAAGSPGAATAVNISRQPQHSVLRDALNHNYRSDHRPPLGMEPVAWDAQAGDHTAGLSPARLSTVDMGSRMGTLEEAVSESSSDKGHESNSSADRIGQV